MSIKFHKDIFVPTHENHISIQCHGTCEARLRELTTSLDEYKKELDLLKKEMEERKLKRPKSFREPNKQVLTLRKKTKYIIYKFITTPWCYGLSRIVKAQNTLFRIMWSIAFIIAAFVCVRIISQTVREFYGNIVITEIKTSRNQKIVFPQVTVCTISSSKQNISSDSYNIEYMDDFDIQVDFCLFDGIPCKNSHDIVYVYSMIGKKQKCLRFNGGYNSTGHAIDLYHQTIGNSLIGGYSVVFTQKNISNNNYKLVYINDNLEQPILEHQTFLSNNQHVNIIEAEKIIHKKLQLPYNDCINQYELKNSKDSLIEKTIKFNNVYNQNKCFYLCFFKKITEKFNCTYNHLYETDSKIDCIESYYSDIYKLYTLNAFNIESNCIEDCPLECHSTSFNYQKTEFVNTELSVNAFSFSISFPNLKVTKYIESPKTTYSSLISSIGGSMGLFVGIRLLSFVDILEFILEFLLLGITSLKSKLCVNSSNRNYVY